MYEKFYGFHSKPFQLNPDPGFYFASTQHRRAKAYLDYGVMRNEGFVVITGDIGAGKTTVVRGLLESFETSDIVAAQLVSTQLEADDLLRAIGAAFGVRVRDVPKSELLMALEVFLVSQAGMGKRCLLIVDEAQNLSLNALEELRMLSNFQFGKQALLQSFLVGQPEFRNKINDPTLLQLRQRIIAACHIGPLAASEIKQYVEHRLNCAGSTDFVVFADEVYSRVFSVTKGIPRNINLVFDRILLQGFLDEKRNFSLQDVEAVLAELGEETRIFGALAGNAQTTTQISTDSVSSIDDCNRGVDLIDSNESSDALSRSVRFLLTQNKNLISTFDDYGNRLKAVEDLNSDILSAINRLDDNFHGRAGSRRS